MSAPRRNCCPKDRKRDGSNSGDRAYRADGEIFITGRVKDIILKAGRNLYPHEIEEIAGQVPGVRKGCVVAFGRRKPSSGTERLVVVAETREATDAARQKIARAITEAVATAVGLPPDVVELVRPHSIPKTSSGKLRREETRRLYLAGSLGAATAPPWLQVMRLATANVARKAIDVADSAHSNRRTASTVLIFRAVDCPDVGAGGFGAEPACRRKDHQVGIAGVLPADWLPHSHHRARALEYATASRPRSNHTSYFDVLVLMAALGLRVSFRRQERSAPHAVHRHVPAEAGPFRF